MNIVEFAKTQKIWVTGSVQYWGLRSEFHKEENVDGAYCLDAPIVLPSGSCKKSWATYGNWKSNDGFYPKHGIILRENSKTMFGF